jgi:hypothetical protein
MHSQRETEISARFIGPLPSLSSGWAIFAAGEWAEPDIEHAADVMRQRIVKLTATSEKI